DPAPLDRVGELIQHVEAVRLRGEVPLDLLPALPGVGGMVGLGARPGDPRPALAHLVPGHRGALAGLLVHPVQCLEGGLLPGLPLRALHELVHDDRPALVPCTQRQPERGGGLALHLAGVHHDQRTVPALPGGQPVVRDDQRFPLRHHATSRSCLPGGATPRNPPMYWPGGTTPLEPPRRARTDSRKGAAASSSRRSRTPPRDRARAPARPSRTGPDSQSTTTLCTPAAASSPAARCALATGSAPPVARPSVTRTSSGRRRGSRMRSARSRSPARSRPAASGVRPPVGSADSRAAAASTENVGGSATSAPPPRNVTMPTLSRRW